MYIEKPYTYFIAWNCNNIYNNISYVIATSCAARHMSPQSPFLSEYLNLLLAAILWFNWSCILLCLVRTGLFAFFVSSRIKMYWDHRPNSRGRHFGKGLLKKNIHSVHAWVFTRRKTFSSNVKICYSVSLPFHHANDLASTKRDWWRRRSACVHK